MSFDTQGYFFEYAGSVIIPGYRRLMRQAACWLIILLLPGCDSAVLKQDREDQADPDVRRAMAYHQQGDPDRAIQVYRDALTRNPLLTRAHLDLALLLHDYERDYVGAIHHYRQYLLQRPQTEKRIMIEGRIRQAGQLYAATFFRSESKAADRVTELERENHELKERLGRMEDDLRRARRAAEKQPVVSSRPATKARPKLSYRVQRGDSLESIALDVYGDASQERLLYDANRQLLGTDKLLKEGQLLDVP
ncbi:MAG: hypothetical protein A2498_12330 [Lentisphaerae bacterium RIFOXYC12_FULL_60_16]|nr:MAG: hypothetical protein A2498_12330 [Lentisphaerae bacterium RIFOXYC12_FULL_60_16]OGV70189.1 MAG: hypothetical protein A2269_08900 [Lentisphaerae bacterium RIFOXYA12_FULL_60_10]OGV75229.1 MAG: hypothetical protein A2340_05935 [Lentisphaerae bacterium RIFOXYB12_FULL_60_10]